MFNCIKEYYKLNKFISAKWTLLNKRNPIFLVCWMFTPEGQTITTCVMFLRDMRDLILGTFHQIFTSMSNCISCNCGIPSSIVWRILWLRITGGILFQKLIMFFSVCTADIMILSSLRMKVKISYIHQKKNNENKGTNMGQDLLRQKSNWKDDNYCP